MVKTSNFDFSTGIMIFLAIVWLNMWFILPYIAEQFNNLNQRLDVAKTKRMEYINARKELMNAVDSEENNLALRGVY